MNRTTIEWALNPDGSAGYTWNPITGCLNGCEYCYAEKIAKRFFPQGFEPSFYPERLSEKFPRKPSRIFTCSMADLFGSWNPDWQVNDILDTIRLHPEHEFQLLTKQPQNLIKFSPFPDNAWVGVSATDAEQYWDAWHGLKEVKASVKYISFEPLLHGIAKPEIGFIKAGISWVIIGAQTNPTIMPKIEWVNEIVEACDKAGIQVFLKDNLAPLIQENYRINIGYEELFFRHIEGVPSSRGIRQQMPKAT